MDIGHRYESSPFCAHWKEIAQEAAAITKYLDLKRTQDDWFRYFIENLCDADGWTKSWTGKWWSFPLVIYDHITPQAQRLCPFTSRLFSRFPGVIMAGFSLFEPGAFVDPHVDTETGIRKHRMAIHLGLDCPDDGCYLIQGSKQWKEENGKLWWFDATVEHYAVNTSSQRRIILYMDAYIDMTKANNDREWKKYCAQLDKHGLTRTYPCDTSE